MRELVGLAIACGALDLGGPLTKSEMALVQGANLPTKIAARGVRAAIRDGADPLGDAFCALRSALHRRPLGAFYTSSEILEPMMDWALAQSPQRFVDPGCAQLPWAFRRSSMAT